MFNIEHLKISEWYKDTLKELEFYYPEITTINISNNSFQSCFLCLNPFFQNCLLINFSDGVLIF